ncbi:tRNA1Val (adenine37-N6)-methyltransferase [Dysgonomonas sp. PFB1-18]|uniref:tRNA1(Val) (adenine(37)-N6)-methyltransferase n=1 Tax=unclassified Dysgonomonas TaxID=2630389 RepID=UPI0024764F2A|nr:MULTISPECIES: methyltransferase [unclassified Dysgonomonas]MDH6308241.1 tRNA1Val (adenine37-N6)-methyltransferase [Dysgonomonas sp. PF1-14]MDH6338320.1 tRNA1Val (adenine37-N6)-methyltransferase [Dysgonomonas sp. PF1-16]MDH6379817.1 tRNA1Val (adenine37-N6)-methyltransferase [Dysgonomonas sp. PFB1-18]MDH6397093.1 tRNA1Val (adenine37-N6)-methyltransferase [Dysgonomonas sp. PF1-23]
MPNPYFRFKQFTVYHDRCAMKVGTDGVLLGAWCDVQDAVSALDVGTGTGLIALMLAQRNPSLKINAIDIEENAVIQACENIDRFPLAGGINCFCLSLQDFAEQIHLTKKYDLIVSNPPYFEQSLKSPNRGRTLARHTDTLPINELLSTSTKLLSDKGKLSVIYPYEYKDTLLKLSEENQLYISRFTNVHPTPTSAPKRILAELTKQAAPLIETDLVIEKERHVYSDGFTALVKDFYLKL